MLIDSHVNLHAPAFADDREAVIARARAAGVGVMLAICDRLDNAAAVEAAAAGHPDIWRTVGTHPHEAQHFQQVTPDQLTEACQGERVVGVGECGLDYHYDHSPRDVQRRVFATHIEAARRLGLPLVVHTREADADMLAMLEEAWAEGPLKVLLHCYTSGPQLAARAAEQGAYFSVAGIVTFKAAEEVRALVRDMPGDRILVETDCPYLTPAPLRGRRNEPAYLPHVLAKVAEVRGWSLAEAERITTDAFFSLFDRVQRPSETL